MIVFNLLLLALLTAAVVVLRRQRRAFADAAARHAAELQSQRAQSDATDRAERLRLEAMLDAMIEGLVVIDPARRIVLANRAAESMFGFSRMMAGGSLLEAIRHHEVATLATRALNEPSAIEHEVRLERPQPRVLQVSAVALRAGPGEPPGGAVLVFHDVTRLRQLEAVRQDFVANVSHELRTPLSLIKSAAETLIDGGRNDPAITVRFLDIIDRHASRLTLLIDDLLLLARLDAEHVELDLKDVPLHAAVQETIDDVALTERGRGATLINDVPRGTVVHADPVRLRQVLGNLVDNAVKYGRPQGTVRVLARRSNSQLVEVAVRDDGPGIPADAMQRVFERFYRVDKARSREQGGTGLGLAIVKNVVQAHGGDVRVESEPGQGATFFFTLPTAEPATPGQSV